MVVSLDDLDEDGRAVLERLGEDLEQVAVVVVINEDLQLLQGVDVFLDLDLGVLEALAELVVVGVRNVEELGAAVAQVLDTLDDVVRAEGQVLDASRAVVVNVLFNLGLALAGGRFVHGHLDGLFPVGHDDGAQGRVLRVDLRVVHRPEAVKHEVVLVPLGHVLHGEVGLVAHDVVDPEGAAGRQVGQQAVLDEGRLVVGQEQAGVVGRELDKGVGGVAVGLDGGKADGAVLVRLRPDLLHDLDPLFACSFKDAVQVLNGEGDVLDAVTMKGQVLAHHLGRLGVRLVARLEDEEDVVLADDVAGHAPLPCLQALVGHRLKAQPSTVVGGGLLGIAHPPLDMVEVQKLSFFRLGPLKQVK